MTMNKKSDYENEVVKVDLSLGENSQQKISIKRQGVHSHIKYRVVKSFEVEQNIERTYTIIKEWSQWEPEYSYDYKNYKVPKVVESPPKFAQFLIYLLVKKDTRDAILGDLEEEYREVFCKFGSNKAKFFYYWQIGRSIWPLVSAFIGKIIKLFIKGIVSRFSVSK